MDNAELVIRYSGLEFPVELSSDDLAMLVSRLPDEVTLSEAYGRLATHTDSTIRKAVAGKKHLPDTAVHALATDAAIGVVKELLTSPDASRRLFGNEVLLLCRRDPDLAAIAAGRYEDFTLTDSNVIDFLESHSDAMVREALAGNPFVPKGTLQRMASKDSICHVRRTAALMLE